MEFNYIIDSKFEPWLQGIETGVKINGRGPIFDNYYENIME